jgi:hypothetical protein
MTNPSNDPNPYAIRGWLLNKLNLIDVKIMCLQEDKRHFAQRLFVTNEKIKKLEEKKVE